MFPSPVPHTSDHPQRPKRRRLLYTTVIALVVLAITTALAFRRPQTPPPPQKTPAQWNAEQWQRILTFTLPPDQVVYEEDIHLAARLDALPPDPRAAYVGDPDAPAPPPYFPRGAGDYHVSPRGGGVYAEYLPEFYRYMFGGVPPRGLLFMHERVAPGALHRLVMVTQDRTFPDQRITVRSSASDFKPRNGLELTTWSSATDIKFRPRNGNNKRYFVMPLGADQVLRIYAGQADPTDRARFTMRYEIDNVPGTIEGRLQEDGTVSLRPLDGPVQQFR